MLRFEPAKSKRSPSTSSSESVSTSTSESDTESASDSQEATVPIYEEFMSSQSATTQTPVEQHPAEDGGRHLTQILERIETFLSQQQVQSSAVPSEPPIKKTKSNGSSSTAAGGSAASVGSAKTKKQLEEVFSAVRDKLTEVTDLLKQ